jgi:hypothetical protein
VKFLQRVYLKFLLLAVIPGLTMGCACERGVSRAFRPADDAFAYANELRWKYEFDSDGNATSHENEPAPEYSLRCFPMTRSAREFFYHARFEPDQPRLNAEGYERIVDEILGRNSRCPSLEADRVGVPGFANLHEFSGVYGDILKGRCGSAAQSFLQRGNWRMIFPLTHRRQARSAAHFVEELRAGRVPIVHVYQFPDTSLNHAILIYESRRSETGITFLAYDPNDPSRPAELKFDDVARTFLFERNQYFAGGVVKVYEVYHGLCY